MDKNRDEFIEALKAINLRPKKPPSWRVKMLLWFFRKTKNVDANVSYPFWMFFFFGLKIGLIHLFSRWGYHKAFELGSSLALVISLFLLILYIAIRHYSRKWRKV